MMRYLFALLTSLTMLSSFAGAAELPGAVPANSASNQGVQTPGVPPLTPQNDPRNFRHRVISDAQIDSELAALSPSERKIMHEALLHLPEDKRENVYYETLDGVIHTKSGPDLHGAFTVTVPGSRALRNRYGQLVVPPPDSPYQSTVTSSRSVTPQASAAYSCRSIPAFGGTGPYREIYSTCSTPATLATVYLPCATYNYFAYPGFETGYIYSGGFSASGNAIDAGLQYSSASDNYALFVRGKYGQMSPNAARFRCGQYVSLEFEPYDYTHLDVVVNGYNVNGVQQTTLFLYQVQFGDGWSPQCGKCLVKRVTSIGQNSPYNDDFVSGSYFGTLFSGGRPYPEVAWSGARVGFFTRTVNGRAYYSSLPWSSQYTGGFVNYPNDGSRLIITFQDTADEVDGIYLHY